MIHLLITMFDLRIALAYYLGGSMSVKENQISAKGRMDVLDFIIKILREHERTLDTLIGRLEMLCQEYEHRILREEYASASSQTVIDSKRMRRKDE